MTRQRIVPPECIDGGKPPCPICPVRSKCAWARQILKDDERKIASCKGDEHRE